MMHDIDDQSELHSKGFGIIRGPDVNGVLRTKTDTEISGQLRQSGMCLQRRETPHHSSTT
jgi:hypothetical protein